MPEAELRRTPCLRTSENSPSTHFGEYKVQARATSSGYWLRYQHAPGLSPCCRCAASAPAPTVRVLVLWHTTTLLGPPPPPSPFVAASGPIVSPEGSGPETPPWQAPRLSP